jgi:DNA-binding FadR family transcriptional regulator
LEAQGYVITTRGATGGTSVASPSEHHWLPENRKDVQELDSQFEFRLAIERATARLAAEKRLDNHLDEMEAAIDALLNSGDNAAETRHADARFHLTLAMATKNHRLVDALRVVRSELFLPSASHRSLSDNARSAAEHKEVLGHIRRKDADAAELAMQSHIKAIWRLYRDDLLSAQARSGG